MVAIRRLLLRGMGILGALVVIQSIFWELARMNPSYNFLVTPWSMRGYDSVHGTIYTAIGVALLVAVLLVMWKRSSETVPGLSIVGYMVLASVVLVAVFADEPKIDPATGGPILDAQGDLVTESALVVIPLNVAVTLLLSLVAAILAYRAIQALRARVELLQRRGTNLGVAAAAFVLAYVIISAVAGEGEVESPAWLAMLIAMLILAVLATTARPTELAANRMLIYSSVVAGAAVGLSAGALRSTLLRFQLAEVGAAAQYKDAQVTWGYFLANIGVVLVFVGAVAFWARRRDLILNLQRARRQREAAMQSAAEIAAAGQAATTAAESSSTEDS